MLYMNIETQEIRELDPTIVAMWKDTNNPKLLVWNELPIKPSEDSIWENNEWITPPIEVPQTISARQIRMWLVSHGINLATVESAINEIEDVQQRALVMVEWEYAPYIERSHPMLVPISVALGFTEEQIDQAFIEGNLL